MVLSYSYLFDRKGFLKKIEPVIDSINKGDYVSLFKLAKETLELNPQLWETLYDLSFGSSFDEELEQLNPSSLLTKILAQYLQEISRTSNAWRMLQSALGVIGWSESDIHLLLYGNPVCDIVQIYESLSTEPEHKGCSIPIGFLNQRLVTNYKNQLAKSKTAYWELINDPPNEIYNAFHIGNDMKGEKKRWLSNSLVDSYHYMIQVLGTIEYSDKDMAIAIAH